MDSTHFYIALFVHLVSLVVGFGAVLVIDTYGLLMSLGKVTLGTVTRTARITQVLIWLGWTGMVISGLNLIVLKGSIDNLTWVKIFLVGMIGVNGIFLHYIKRYLEKVPSADRISDRYRYRIFVTTLISQFGWWGSVVIGFYHRHVAHQVQWPAHPLQVIGPIAAGFLLLAVAGEIYFTPANPKRS